MIDGVKVPFTAEEETARDAEEKAWADGATSRAAQAEINRLEAEMTPRRLREHLDGTETGGWWMAQNALINAERSKL
jgi:hypothetical protein